VAAAGLLALTICCAREPESHTPPARRSVSTATATPMSRLPADPTRTAEPPADTIAAPSIKPSLQTVAPAPVDAEDGRKLLEREGIDPDELSRDVGEQMRRRFKSTPLK
jgi:hypothetical protein